MTASSSGVETREIGREEQSEKLLLEALRAACESGQRGSGMPGQPTAMDLELIEWKERIRYRNLAVVDAHERMRLAAAKAACDRARDAAVQGDPLEAWRQIAIAESRAVYPRITPAAGLLFRTDVLAAEAAVEYQSDNMASCLQKLLEASRTDDVLERSFNIEYLHAHRVHLLGKMVQWLAANGRTLHAVQLAAYTLLYLAELRLPAWPTNERWDAGAWDTRRVAALPLSVRQMLSQQIVIEMGAALMSASIELQHQAVRAIAPLLGVGMDDLTLDLYAGAWLQAKLLSSESAFVTEHLQACCRFLSMPRDKHETLWLLGALDAAQRCGEMAGSEAALFRSQVFTELARHPAFPRRFRDGWERLAKL